MSPTGDDPVLIEGTGTSNYWWRRGEAKREPLQGGRAPLSLPPAQTGWLQRDRMLVSSAKNSMLKFSLDFFFPS